MNRLTLPIRTPRLLLRDFVWADFPAVLSYASDPEVTRFMFHDPRDEADTRAYLTRMLDSQIADPRVVWELAVVESDSGLLVGSCDLTLEDDRTADLGYIFGRPWWGRGYASEAAATMVRVGFEQLGLDRIFAMCDIDHIASQRVMEHAGLTRTAVVNGAREAKGRSWDMCRYEILRREWRGGE